MPAQANNVIRIIVMLRVVEYATETVSPILTLVSMYGAGKPFSVTQVQAGIYRFLRCIEVLVTGDVARRKSARFWYLWQTFENRSSPVSLLNMSKPVFKCKGILALPTTLHRNSRDYFFPKILARKHTTTMSRTHKEAIALVWSTPRGRVFMR